MWSNNKIQLKEATRANQKIKYMTRKLHNFLKIVNYMSLEYKLIKYNDEICKLTQTCKYTHLKPNCIELITKEKLYTFTPNTPR